MAANDKTVPALEDLRMLRRHVVLDVVGLSESRIRQLERAGQFPKRIALGDNAVGWLEKDIRAWLADRIANGRLVPRGVTAPPAPKPPRRAPTRKGA